MVAPLPKLIKGQGRLERHNCVLIDSSLSCVCSESELIRQSHTVASLAQACAPPCCCHHQPVLACSPGCCAGAVWVTLHMAPHVPGVLCWVECSRWKDKSSDSAKDVHMEVLKGLVKRPLCCTGNVGIFL